MLHKDDNSAFIILNIHLKGETKESADHSLVNLPSNFNVASYTDLNDNSEAKEVNVTMDFCVDYSIGEIVLGNKSF